MQVVQNRTNKECNKLANEGARLRRDLNTQTANCARLSSEDQIRAAALKSMELSLAAAKLENTKLSRTVEASNAQLRLAEERRTALEMAQEDARHCSSLTREVGETCSLQFLERKRADLKLAKTKC